MKNYHLNLTERQIKSWNKLGYLLRPKHLKENIKDIIKSISNIEDTDIKKRKSLFYYEEIDSKPRLCRIEKFIDDNTILFVVIHELTHVMTEEVGHTPLFWSNMKYLLEEGKKAGIYSPVDYRKNPTDYCGMEINTTPYEFGK